MYQDHISYKKPLDYVPHGCHSNKKDSEELLWEKIFMNLTSRLFLLSPNPFFMWWEFSLSWTGNARPLFSPLAILEFWNQGVLFFLKSPVTADNYLKKALFCLFERARAFFLSAELAWVQGGPKSIWSEWWNVLLWASSAFYNHIIPGMY